ncbi:MAG: hypothetical protein IPP63_19110 [Chloracidobacterium sp.]|nr:hypothetical protein [Chloracidobacterium sp.]
MAFDTLRSNKLLVSTIVGVVVGVITVMLISSIISGINVAAEKEIESFGTRSIFLYKMDIGIRTSQPTREERMLSRSRWMMPPRSLIWKTIEVAVPFLDISNNFFGQKINVTGKNGKLYIRPAKWNARQWKKQARSARRWAVVLDAEKMKRRQTSA